MGLFIWQFYERQKETTTMRAVDVFQPQICLLGKLHLAFDSNILYTKNLMLLSVFRSTVGPGEPDDKYNYGLYVSSGM